MKIATWNIERPKPTGPKAKAIIEYLKELNADILVLTETNEAISPGAAYESFHTDIFPGDFYKPGDRQVSIFSKYRVIEQFSTFRSDTSLCFTVDTPYGNLTIYGTILGNFGNKGSQFKDDLQQQLSDFARIGVKDNFCVLGDLNISFSDNFYFTKEGRKDIQQSFAQLDMQIMTEGITKNIDHIVLSKKFIDNKKHNCGYWNDTENKTTRLSDHKGVFLEIFE